MRARDAIIELGAILLVLLVGYAVSIPLQNPPLIGAMLSLYIYAVIWMAYSRIEHDMWWAVKSDLEEEDKQESILEYGKRI